MNTCGAEVSVVTTLGTDPSTGLVYAWDSDAVIAVVRSMAAAVGEGVTASVAALTDDTGQSQAGTVGACCCCWWWRGLALCPVAARWLFDR